MDLKGPHVRIATMARVGSGHTRFAEITFFQNIEHWWEKGRIDCEILENGRQQAVP
jgi:hypothetical protein